MRSTRHCCVAVFLSIAVLCPPVHAQEKKPEKDLIKISAELVEVDVLVTDQNNRPAAGLGREDFELLDNGKRQTITHFAFEQSANRKPEAGGDPSVSLPRGLAAGNVKRVIAFVVDTLHMRHDNVYRTRRTLEEFIQSKLEPGDLVLVLPTAGGSGLYQQFTSDQRILLNAVSRLRPFLFANEINGYRNDTRATTSAAIPRRPPDFPRPGEAAPASGPGQEGDPVRRQGNHLEIDRSAGSNPLEESDVLATLGTLHNLLDAMAKLPGRKIGVFLSEGFRANSSQTSKDLAEVAARAARSNVIFYSIDPKGLDPLGVAADDDLGLRGAAVVNDGDLSGLGADYNKVANERLGDVRNDHAQFQESLTTLAVDTGGKFYRNSNDIKRGLSEVLDENSGYYLLGFQPEKWDGKFHELRVAVRGRPELTVSTRKGYFARVEKPKENSGLSPKMAELIEAMNSPLVRRDIDLQFTPYYKDDQKRDPMMMSFLQIDASRLKFKQAGSRYRTSLELTAFILDEAGNAADRFADTINLDLDKNDYETALGGGLHLTRNLSVRPGVYQLRAFVRETESGQIGTTSSYVEVPALKGDQLALSSLFVSAGGSQGSPSTAFNEDTLSRRRFRRSEDLNYMLVVYNAKAENSRTQLEMRTRILKAGQVVFNSQWKPVEGSPGSNLPSRLITGGTAKLASLSPDDYLLEVMIVDKLRKKDRKSLVRQEIDFSVE